MNDNSYAILISGAGTATCQSVIKGLRKQNCYTDIQIISYDMNPENAGRFMSDDFCTVPAASDEQFMREIECIVREHRINAIVPIVDWEFRKLAASQTDFLDRLKCFIVISPADAIEICDDKLRMNEFLVSLGIKTPRIYSLEEARSLDKEMIIKPRINGRGSIDVFKIKSKRDVPFYLQQVQDPLFMEHMKGEEFTIDLMFDFESKPVAGLVRRRIETKGGLAYKAEVVIDKQALGQAYEIGNALKIIGPANMQFLKVGSGDYFFDLNPRFSGALACTIGAGLNMPLLLLHLLRENQIAPSELEYRLVKMYRYWNEFFSESQ